jgi:hypothetical protein
MGKRQVSIRCHFDTRKKGTPGATQVFAGETGLTDKPVLQFAEPTKLLAIESLLSPNGARLTQTMVTVDPYQYFHHHGLRCIGLPRHPR